MKVEEVPVGNGATPDKPRRVRVHELVDAVVLRQAGVDRNGAEENETGDGRDGRRDAFPERLVVPEDSHGAPPSG